MFKAIDIIYKPTKRIEIEPFAIFLMIFQKHIHLYIQKEKKECQERINAISVIIAINFLFWKQGEKDIWKIVQEGQELSIILIIKI